MAIGICAITHANAVAADLCKLTQAWSIAPHKMMTAKIFDSGSKNQKNIAEVQ
jgi:hypothetical protein